MARSTRKSLAGSAAAAAKKVIPRRGRADGVDKAAAAPAKKTTAKKTTAKKTTAKKSAAPAKKTATRKAAAPAKKTVAKQTVAKKAPAKKTTATNAAVPAKKTATKKAAAPAKKTAAKKTPAKKTAATNAAVPAKKTATKKAAAPVKKTATKKAASKRTPARKATAQKAADLVVKEGENAWTKAELDEVLGELNEHAARLRRELHEQEEELAGLMRDAGDGAGQDQADLGATSFERDHELTVVNNAREMLAQTERALARIADGSYGICESCGNPIGKMRVMAFPRATLCMTCKQREERR